MFGRFPDIPVNDDGIYDVVILGGGPSGLLMANKLGKQGLSIALFEAGSINETKRSTDFFDGEVVNSSVHPLMRYYRARAIGGSSRIWGGRCIPFDPIDFELRDWVPNSGWPINYNALQYFYANALEAAEAGQMAFHPLEALPDRQRELVPGLDGVLVRSTIERFSKPTNFWTRFGSELSEMPNVCIFIEASATSLRLTPDGGALQGVEVASPDGQRKIVRGKYYVLAMGGLETTRLLLASNDVRPNGIGNDHDMLGRHYMCHLGTTAGKIHFRGPPTNIAFDYERDREGVYVRRRLWLSEAAQREFSLLNTTFRTHLPEPANPDHGDAILSAMYLVKDLVLYEYSRKFVENPVSWRNRLRHVGNILTQPRRIATFGMRWLKNRTFAERKLPSVVLPSRENSYALEFHAEQAPNPYSRLTLTSDRDRHDMPRLKLDWRITELDVSSLQRSYELLDKELRRTGTGWLDYNPDNLVDRAKHNSVVGGHFIGTTRMSHRHEDGVVNPDCRVHGVDNLYVASSSVFPTSGQANPTLTILALSIRLSDHLTEKLRS